MDRYMCYIANDLNVNTKNKCVKKCPKQNKSAKHCFEIAQKDTSVSQTLLDVDKL